MTLMLRKRNKKAIIFQVGIVLLAIIGLTYGYTTLASIREQQPIYTIGEQQFALYRAYQEYFNEVSMIELDLSDYIAQVIVELAHDGGFYRPGGTEGEYGGCGSYYGYANWNTINKSIDECAPADVRVAFEYALRELMPQGLYRIRSIEDTADGTNILLEPQQDITTGGSVRMDPESRYEGPDIPPDTLCTGIGACSPPLVSYQQATALQGPACSHYPETYTPSVCRYTPRSAFDTLFTIKDPASHHMVLGNPDGNAITPQLARHLINISESWYREECERAGKEMCDEGDDCCQAAIYVSSLSTAEHAATSHHNIGNAADISRCSDADGQVSYAIQYHYGEEAGETFGRCYKLIREYYKRHMDDGGTLIAPEDCIGLSCDSRSESVKRDLMAHHDDHIHINPPDPVISS